MLGLQGRRGIKESQDKPAHRCLAPLDLKDHQDLRVLRASRDRRGKQGLME